MFSPALTAAPTVGTIAFAAITVSVPVAVVTRDINTGLASVKIIALMGVAAAVFNTLKATYTPLQLAGGAFAFGFITGYITTKDARDSIVNGIFWAVMVGTPTANIILNNLGLFGARSFAYIAKSMGQVPQS